MAFDKHSVPPELFDNFKKGLSIYFVGAGLSQGAGYPTWAGLLNKLIDHAERQPWVDTAKVAEYRSLMRDSSKWLMVAEEVKVDLGSEYQRFMENMFANSSIGPTEAHELIVTTEGNMVITINYDDLLERAYVKKLSDIPNKLTYAQSREAANNFWRERFFILKAHGDAKQDVNSLILSQKDYRRTLYREAGYRSLLQSIFTSKSVVFVGVSLADPEFNQLLDYLHDSYHGGGPTHYLLMDRSKSLMTTSRRYLDDFNIKTIPYDNSSGNHAEVTEFLRLVQLEAPLVP